jgi:aminomethyltransferase
MQKTALNEEHKALGAKMVPFAGWEMPVQYDGIRQEHTRVREAVGLFDVSHMGEIEVVGAKSLETLQWLTSNDVSKLAEGQAQYSLLTNEQGGIVDDLIVYCLIPEEHYLLCVNAANADKDWKHIQANNKGADLKNASSEWSQIAVQGPKSFELLERIFPGVSQLKSFHFGRYDWVGAEVLIARTGYTGEEGVEIFVPNAPAPALWKELLEKGADLGVGPVGLGARDTLRTEMKYSLYGQEITDDTNPYAAGLGWVVKPDAKDFIGKEKILAQKSEGLSHKLVGFKMVDKGIPRHGYKVVNQAAEPMGEVTSGTMSPTSGENIGIAYVPKEFSAVGSEIWVDIRGRAAKATVVETPFIKRS